MHLNVLRRRAVQLDNNLNDLATQVTGGRAVYAYKCYVTKIFGTMRYDNLNDFKTVVSEDLFAKTFQKARDASSTQEMGIRR